MDESSGIVTYPVGLLADLKKHRIDSVFYYLRYQINARNWRAVCVLLRQNGTKRMVELNEILMTNNIKIRPRE